MFESDERDRAATALLSDLTRTGQPLPPAVDEAVKVAEKQRAALAELDRRASVENVAALLGQVAAGKTPTPSEVALTVLALSTAGRPERQGVEREVHRGVVHALRDHGAAVVETFRESFDAAAADVAAAADALGAIDLEDVRAVAQIGGDAAEMWKRAKAADTVVVRILQTVLRLGVIGGYPQTGDARERALAVVDTDLSGYRRIGPRGATAWELHKVGRLSLATPEQFEQRRARIAEQWETDPANPATRGPAGAGQYPHGVPLIGESL